MGKDSLLSYNRFRESSAWIILILGMLLYYISYFHIEQPSVWKEILIKIGDVLVEYAAKVQVVIHKTK